MPVIKSSILGSLLLAAHLQSAEAADLYAPELIPYTQATLMARFDADNNAQLSPAERKTARASFGNVDVPMLPSPPHRYAESVPLHSSVPEDLRSSDNTPVDNRLTDTGAALGRVLFYDRRLSANHTIACASCHHQRHGFSDPERFSMGYAGGRTGRNAMGLINLRYSNLRGSRPGFFWDERAATLEDQVLMPIQDQVEMGMRLGKLTERLQEVSYYPPLFDAAFGSRQITSERIARAVAQFMRAMVSFDTKFDRSAAAVGGDFSRPFATFTPAENSGKSLFIDGVDRVGEMGCAHCHLPPTFGMPKSFNNGLDLVYSDQGLGARDAPNNDPFTPSNDGKFKAPSLRNVELTAPYMHDGRFRTLKEVIQHYSDGVHPHPNLALVFNDQEPDDNSTSGFKLSDNQQADLLAFLKTLTDKSFIADPRFSDLFIRTPE